MNISPSPSAAVVCETKCCVAGWTAVGLVIGGVLGRTLEAFRSKSIAEIFALNALVEGEGAELLVATCSKTTSTRTVGRGDQQSKGVE